MTGLTEGTTSFFRMKVFNGTNKLVPGVPIANKLKSLGDFQYYWFTSTAANTTDNRAW